MKEVLISTPRSLGICIFFSGNLQRVTLQEVNQRTLRNRVYSFARAAVASDKIGWFKQYKFNVSPFGGWRSKIKVGPGWFLQKAMGKGFVPCLPPSFWGFAGNHWRSL